MRLKTFAFAAVLLITTVQVPAKGQLRDSYTEQQNRRNRDELKRQDAINIICKKGQFIAPTFGASGDRHVYYIDRNKEIFRYTDATVSGENFTDNDYSSPGTSSMLTCKSSNGFITSLPYANLGKIGTAFLCNNNNEVCEYSVEKLGLYVYQKPRNGLKINRVFLANHRNRIEIGNSGTYRTCSGYFNSPTERRICFGK